MKYICKGGPRDGWEGNTETPYPFMVFPEGKYRRVTPALEEPVVYQYQEDE
jgi:hypothetical protein